MSKALGIPDYYNHPVHDILAMGRRIEQDLHPGLGLEQYLEQKLDTVRQRLKRSHISRLDILA